MDVPTTDAGLRSADHLCRACVQELRATTTREAEKFVNILETPELLNKLTICISHEFTTNSKCSKYLCMDCFEIINEFFEFREMCQESTRHFEELQLNKEVKPFTNLNDVIIKEEYDLTATEMTSNRKNASLVISKKVYDLHEAQGTTKSNSEEELQQHKEVVKPFTNLNDVIIKEEYDLTATARTTSRAYAVPDLNGSVNEHQKTNEQSVEKPLADLEHAVSTKTELVSDEDDVEFIMIDDSENESLKESIDSQDHVRSVNKNVITEESKSVPPTSSNATPEKTIIGRKKKSSKCYYCRECPARFYIKSRFNAHSRKHLGLQPYLCARQGCTQAFNEWFELSRHLKEHEKTSIEYVCDQKGCDKVYKLESKLIIHKKLHQKLGVADLKSLYTCEDCGKSYKRAKLLENHKHIHKTDHERPFSCVEPNCYRRFKCKKMRRLHIVRQHRSKKYECPRCNVRTGTQQQLENHMKYHNKNERICPQPSCKEVFNSIVVFRAHMRNIHKDLSYMEYACRYCQLKFHTQHTRKYHEMRHTGEKPNVCATCGKSFIQPNTLRAHMRVHERE